MSNLNGKNTSLTDISTILPYMFIIITTVGSLTLVIPYSSVFGGGGGAGADTDGDGLLDEWESWGVDFDKDGTTDLNLPLHGANPDHKDIFVEIDHMEGHFPGLQVVNNIRQSFEDAPVDNPDGNIGINLHLVMDEQIPHEDLTTGLEFYDIRLDYFGTKEERDLQNHLIIDSHAIEAKELVYHYAIFGHQMEDDPTRSGGFYDYNTFVITLGHSSWGNHPVTGHDVGSQEQREGTLMHELGHSLGLNHGGGDGSNCKPNYLSVLNYAFQFPNIAANRNLDYSRSELNILDEQNLNENQGIDDSTPPGLTTVHGPYYLYQTLAGIPIDWNADGVANDISVDSDVNYLSGVCNETPDQSLSGHDDWGNLYYHLKKALEFVQDREDNGTTTADKFTTDKLTSTAPTHSTVSSTVAPTLFQDSQFEEISTEQVINMRLLLLESISKSLSNLSDILTDFGNKQRSALLSNLTDPETSRLGQLLKSDNLDQSIRELLNIKSRLSALGETMNLHDKKLFQESITSQMLDNFVTALKKQQ